MCFSSNAIEQQAYRFTERIHNSSLYKIVRIDLIGTSIKMDPEKSLESHLLDSDSIPLIKNIILEDTSNGKKYSVEPNEFGLKFAGGEITYHQYARTRKSEVRKLLFYTIGAAGIFIVSASSFIGYFL
jgi:hypothetical protein